MEGSNGATSHNVSDAYCLVRLQRFCLFQANLPALSLESHLSITSLITHSAGVSLMQLTVSQIACQTREITFPV